MVLAIVMAFVSAIVYAGAVDVPRARSWYHQVAFSNFPGGSSFRMNDNGRATRSTSRSLYSLGIPTHGHQGRNPRNHPFALSRCTSGWRGRLGERLASQNRASVGSDNETLEEDINLSLPALDSPAGAGLLREGIAPHEWIALLQAGEVVSVRWGKLLMSQGDIYQQPDDREVYLLLSGECRIEVQGKPVGRIVTGEFVGEASFTSGRPSPRTATVRATSDDTRVAMWTWKGLREFMDAPGNLHAKASLQAYWMSGLAVKLNDVMSALGGQPVIDVAKEHKAEAGDYGYRYLEDMREVDSIVPVSATTLAWWTFAREYRALRRTFRFGEFKDTGIAVPFSRIDKFLETSVFPVLRPSRADLPKDRKVAELQRRLGELKLSNKAIEEREKVRIAATKALLEDETRKGVRDAGYILRSQTPWFVMVPYKVLCWFLDVVFEDRPIQRFWFLETVARMPYFSYLSMLFLYETLGWWSGGSEVRRIHFAEEYNEMQHLRIMESLGGDTKWSDRFLARHAAIIYYFVLTLGYLVSPFLAYNFSELIESHAVDTYTEFAEVNKELLMSLPATPQALEYYEGGDMYLFDEFQTSRPAFSRRPTIRNLYDVFRSIRDDELEHVKTMFACERGKGSLTSPNAAAATPRWDEDADHDDEQGDGDDDENGSGSGSDASRSSAGGGGAEGGGSSSGETKITAERRTSSLRTDVVRKTPLERFSAALDPLRNLANAVETSTSKQQHRHGSEKDGDGAPAAGGRAEAEAEAEAESKQQQQQQEAESKQQQQQQEEG